MKVKIFIDNGAQCILDMEGKINKWLADNSNAEIKNVQCAMCTISNPGDEQYQSAMITLWYEDRIGS